MNSRGSTKDLFDPPLIQIWLHNSVNHQIICCQWRRSAI